MDGRNTNQGAETMTIDNRQMAVIEWVARNLDDLLCEAHDNADYFRWEVNANRRRGRDPDVGGHLSGLRINETLIAVLKTIGETFATASDGQWLAWFGQAKMLAAGTDTSEESVALGAIGPVAREILRAIAIERIDADC